MRKALAMGIARAFSSSCMPLQPQARMNMGGWTSTMGPAGPMGDDTRSPDVAPLHPTAGLPRTRARGGTLAIIP